MKKNPHEKDTLFCKIMKIITVTLYLLINCTVYISETMK